MSNPIPVRGGPPPVKAMPVLPSTPPAEKETVTFKKIGKDTTGERIVIYGSGSIGKTPLACMLPRSIVFFDLNKNLKKQLPGQSAPSDAHAKTCGGWTRRRSVNRRASKTKLSLISAWHPPSLTPSAKGAVRALLTNCK